MWALREQRRQAKACPVQGQATACNPQPPCHSIKPNRHRGAGKTSPNSDCHHITSQVTMGQNRIGAPKACRPTSTRAIPYHCKQSNIHRCAGKASSTDTGSANKRCAEPESSAHYKLPPSLSVSTSIAALPRQSPTRGARIGRLTVEARVCVRGVRAGGYAGRRAHQGVTKPRTLTAWSGRQHRGLVATIDQKLHLGEQPNNTWLLPLSTTKTTALPKPEMRGGSGIPKLLSTTPRGFSFPRNTPWRRVYGFPSTEADEHAAPPKQCVHF